MQKLLFIMFTLLSASIGAEAQLTLKVPLWEKFVEINTENVNLRRAPSATSQRLMFKGTDFWDPNKEFTWDEQPGYLPYHLLPKCILPVISETSQWYCLYLSTYNPDHSFKEGYEVYVMKRFCSEQLPAQGIEPEYCGCQAMPVAGSKGYLIEACNLGVMSSPTRQPHTRVGHKIGKYIVMADYDVLQFCTGSRMDSRLDIDAVTEAELERVLQAQTTPSVFYIHVVFYNGLTNGLFYYSNAFDASNYSHEMQTYTFP